MDENKTISALIADDHTLYRRGMKMLLDTFPIVRSVDEANNGKEALKMIDQFHYDIVLMDLEMPVMDGWVATRKLLKKYPTIKVIMVSMHDSLHIISDLIGMGVHSYLLKNAEPEEVRKSITSVINNEFYYNRLIYDALKKKHNKKEITPTKREDLSDREIEILQLICQEMTVKEIGEELCLSEQTVQTHRKNLLKKTKVKNVVGAVKYAIQHSIIRL